MITKSRLAIKLSKLKVFKEAKVELEQYPTDSEVAAEVLWQAYLQGDIEGKTVADLGCGTGILGIGALLLGAKSVEFVDIDQDALDICEDNISTLKSEFEGQYMVKNSKVSYAEIKAETVVQNPPFGVKNKNSDREFLEKAVEIGEVIYSMHNSSTKKFVDRFVDEKNCTVTHYWEFQFPLKQTMKYHKKRITRISVGCWRIVKQYRNK